MSNKIVEDIKTGLKGIRGAGDVLRGSAMEATDQAFDNNQNHPVTQASELKNQAIAQKGKNDWEAVDERLAVREREHEAEKQLHTERALEAERMAQPERGAGHHPRPLA
jgi:hypothetical protein